MKKLFQQAEYLPGDTPEGVLEDILDGLSFITIIKQTYPDTYCHHSGCWFTDPGLLSMHHDTGRDNFYFLLLPRKTASHNSPVQMPK